MNASAPTKPRARYGRVLLAVVTALTTVAGTVMVSADAKAADGRRICAYSFKVKPTNYLPNNPRKPWDLQNGNPLLQVSIGMNYKKDGDCPTIKRDALAATGYVDVDQVNPVSTVEKFKCEYWGDTHQTSLTYIGADPCLKMWDDTMYAFIWQDPNTANAVAPSYVQLGHYWDYQ